MNGHFFVFDGMDGAGKSTALTACAEALRARGREVLATREPGGSPLAEAIREVMLRDWPDGMPAETELLLVYAARAAHWRQTIAPALDAGHIVLCDRFVDSSHVYQGVLGGLDPAWIDALTRQTVPREPDCTLIFDLSVDDAEQRMLGRGAGNRFDTATRQRRERVRAAFLERARAQPERYRVLNAAQAPAALAESALEAVSPWLK